MRDETILITGCEPWEHWRQTHNIAYILARENRVVFVYPFVRWENRAGRRDYLQRFRRQELKWVAHNVAVLEAPPMLPLTISLVSRYYSKQTLRLSIRLGKVIQARILRRRLAELGLSPTVLSVWHPFDLLLAGRLGELVACWHLYDEVSRFPGNAPIGDVIEGIEREFIGRADLVFAASEMMFAKRRHLHPRIFLIPNAGDFSLFNQALTSDLPEPADLRSIPHPRIGIIGALGWAVDYGLLLKILDKHPDWSLVLIGSVRASGQEGVDAVTVRPNGFALGYRPQPELPAYLKGLDVGLMPYRVAHSMVEAYPLKMHEYLAAGLPVVSTAQPAVLPFANVVSIGENPDQFVALIERELATNSRDKVAARVAVARENSWERRVEEMSALIDSRLSEARVTRHTSRGPRDRNVETIA